MRRNTVLLLTSTIAFGLVTAPQAVAAPLTAPANLITAGYASSAGTRQMSTADVMSYWTPARLAAATPARVPAAKAASDKTVQMGKAAQLGKAAPMSKPVDEFAKPMRTEPRMPSAAALATAGVTAAASIQAGRVYFIDPLDGREHYCSGATVNSDKRRLVVTAGHCVVNGFWMQGFIFAPGYDNGAPYGFWPAYNLAARTDWIYYATPSADVGIAIMGDNLSGRRIVDVVGGNGLAWNWPSMSRVDGISYPNAQQTQYVCTGSNVPGVDPGTIGMSPCPRARAGGASGGPMVLYLNDLGPGAGYINSVIANYFSPIPNEVYGPYFEDVNAGLFYYAESISP